MPAKSKYLSSKGQRALKITAAILGGYFFTSAIHLLLALIPMSREFVFSFSGFSFFVVWAGLMVVAFLAKNGWKIWGIYLLLTLVLGLVVWYLK